jgi:hypothetical protein
MSALARQRLHTLVDMVDEIGLDTLYNVMIRFIPEDDPLPDEITSHIVALKEIENGDVVNHDDINWD